DSRHVLVCVGNIDEQIQKEINFLQKKNLTYTKIAETLSKNYFSIFYVDIITGYYMEYTSNSTLRSLEIINSGEDFFADCQKNIPKQVCSKDVEMVLLAFQKEKIVNELNRTDSLVLTYRLLLQGTPTYVSTNVVRIDGDPGHILVGVNNVDIQVRRQKKLEKTLKELKKSQTDKLTFLQIALTLSKDYFSVYYVDLKDDHYIEYNSRDEYKELDIEKKGENFFREMRKKMRETIHKEDKVRILSVFTKKFVL
ncbi:MAG: hypothetical protein IJ733_12955, partial [Lachnospiraceae bacterium]|nr:hypothetical protein [Lachnospiraceae bacterium]